MLMFMSLSCPVRTCWHKYKHKRIKLHLRRKHKHKHKHKKLMRQWGQLQHKHKHKLSSYVYAYAQWGHSWHKQKVLADWLIVLCLCLCSCLCQHVLTGHHSDISISISIRGTQGFDKLMLMLMWWPSSLAHKLLTCLRRKWGPGFNASTNVYVNDVLTEHKHKKKAYAYVKAVLTSAYTLLMLIHLSLSLHIFLSRSFDR